MFMHVGDVNVHANCLCECSCNLVIVNLVGSRIFVQKNPRDAAQSGRLFRRQISTLGQCECS